MENPFLNSLIVIEGADSTGKTTLAQTMFPGAIVQHCTYPMLPDVRTAVHNLTVAVPLPSQRDSTYVFDRHWISELVYSQVYREEETDKEQLVADCLWMYAYMIKHDAKYIITHVPKAVMQDNYERTIDAQLYPLDDRIFAVNSIYEAFYAACISRNLYEFKLYDYTTMDFSVVCSNFQSPLTYNKRVAFMYDALKEFVYA